MNEEMQSLAMMETLQWIRLRQMWIKAFKEKSKELENI